MVDPVNPNKPPETPPQSDAVTHEKGPRPKYGAMTAKPMTFLGMHFTGPEAEKLWDSILQGISSTIQKDQAKSLAAIRKLRDSSSGQGSDG